jgi:DNA-directed RNA polymerase specialized sigma24 family protein
MNRYSESLMLPVREEDIEAAQYQEYLGIVRQRVLGFAGRKLVPHLADFAHAEDIAQSCVAVLWEQYPEKRELAEMIRIAIGTARHKIAQFHRDRERMPNISDEAADRLESHYAHNPHSGERLLDRISARQDTDRFLLGMLKLPGRCRELLRLKLIEQKSYAEIRSITGISGNIYEMARRCFQTLLRNMGGNS